MKNPIRRIFALVKRELYSYFSTPLAFVFIIIFLSLSFSLTFYAGQFIERGQADLVPFFIFHPWLYIFLMPAISMRLWSEEQKTGTIELLLTLPVSVFDAVFAKWLAAFFVAFVCLVLTFPMWVLVSFLGSPDHGLIVTSYVGSLLMAGAFLALGAFISTLTRSQIIACIVSVLCCFLLTVLGAASTQTMLTGIAPEKAVRLLTSFGFLTHFSSMMQGVLDVKDILFFASFILLWLYASVLSLEWKKTV